MQFLVLRFYVYSIVDIYGSVKRISPEARSQMDLDLKTILLSCRKFVTYNIDPLESYSSKFFELITYDKPTALSNLVNHLPMYPLRVLKNFFLFSSKDFMQKKGSGGSNFIVKTEDLVTVFELSKSCLISLVEDQKFIEDQDYSNFIVEIVVEGNEKAKSSTAN